MTRQRAMSERNFNRIYKPLDLPELQDLGAPRPQYEWVKDRYETHHVWSVIETDGIWNLIPGYHVVNMMGYVVTEVPWTDEDDRNGLWVSW